MRVMLLQVTPAERAAALPSPRGGRPRISLCWSQEELGTLVPMWPRQCERVARWQSSVGKGKRVFCGVLVLLARPRGCPGAASPNPCGFSPSSAPGPCPAQRLGFVLCLFLGAPAVITLGKSLARGVIKGEGLVNFQTQMTSAMTAPRGRGGGHPKDHQSSCSRARG